MTHVNNILNATTLSNGNKNRLVVCGRSDRLHAVETFVQTLGDLCRENTALSLGVQAFEERETRRVSGISLVERCDLLNGDMLVTLDVLRVGVDLLGCGIVVLVRVGKETGLEVLLRELYGEALVGLDLASVDGEDELAGRHVCLGGDDAHGCGVARASLDLLAVCQGETLVLAKVDEVVL
jgi:hypothetical protein